MSRSPGRAEIAVVGGGIAGTSAAYHLARAGRDVALLERGEIASEASGVNAGSIGALGWGRIPDLQATLTTGSLEIFRSLELDLEQDIEFRQSGALQAIQTEAQYEFARDQVQALRADGYTVELLSIREARSIEPAMSPELLGAVHSPLRAQADPKKATRAFAQVAAAAGARILTGHQVLALAPTGAGYRIETPHGELHAGTLVIAAGAWCAEVGRMLGLDIPIVPVRGQMWASDPVPPCMFQVISSTESALDWHRHPEGDVDTPPELTHRKGARITRHLYGRQTRTGEIIFGGDRETVGYDTSPDPAGVDENKRHAGEVLPFLGQLPVRRTWAGLMPFPLDGEPIIGRILALPDLFIVTGLASSGFGRGPMAGQLIAEYVHTGHRPVVLAEADPARCVVPAGHRPTGEPRASRAPAKRLSVSGSRRKTR